MQEIGSSSDCNVTRIHNHLVRKRTLNHCINEWNKLKPEVRNAKQISVFKRIIITEKKENSVFSIDNPVGVKLLRRLRLQLSYPI